MTRINVPLFTAMLALAACHQDDPNNIAIDNGPDANMSAGVVTLPPSEELGAADNGSGNMGEGNDAAPIPAVIPAQYRGRWGLVAPDCTSAKGDAKGLIAIGDKTIRFYESTATLRERRPAIATSFSGLFDFTGEGQTWQKPVTLTRTGDMLKRADDEGNFSYKRCA